jgi:hypothetical protein
MGIEKVGLTPKVVFGVAWNNMIFRYAPIKPILLRLEIGGQVVLWITLKVCHIQAIRGKLVHVGE